MTKSPLLLFLIIVALLTSMTAARAADATAARIVEIGDNTYSCAYEAPTTFNRDTDKLVEEAKRAAEEFCAKTGKEPQFISVTVEKPWMTLGIPQAVVVFKPLQPGDPALNERMPDVVVRKGIKGKKETAAAKTAAPEDDLYRTLLNLDDLRKKGILTEEEFQAEKKKVLARSK